MVLAKVSDGLAVVFLEVLSQVMVVKHVNDYTSIMPVLPSESVFALAYCSMSVSITINLPVKHHALGHSIRVVLIAIALHKVANEVASGQVGIVS